MNSQTTGGDLTVATPATPGRVIVTERALRRTFEAIAAERLGVAARDVRARVSDVRGSLAVDLESPLAIGERTGSGTSVIDIAHELRGHLREHGHELSGAEISDVRLRVTGARPARRERVR